MVPFLLCIKREKITPLYGKEVIVMPRGYPIGYSYVGFMPDGTKRYFATHEEYLEAWFDALGESE